MTKRVLLATRDLFFRTKLGSLVAARGAELASDELECDVAVVEIESAGWEERIRGLVGRGVAVLAFGSHVRADLLRAAREAGAAAVPNSQVEERLRELL